MDKYVLVTWPEIQDFMDLPGYKENVYLGNSLMDDLTGVWFVPESMYNQYEENNYTA